MTKQEQLARLALVRAARAPRAMVILATNNQLDAVNLLHAIEPKAVLTVFGKDAIRVHGRLWGDPKVLGRETPTTITRFA